MNVASRLDRARPSHALTQLRAYLASRDVDIEARLPPERQLADQLGVSRAELRKALAELETEGRLWRQVGKGTFLGFRPLDTSADIAAMARRSNPAVVMRARLAFEPEVARLAALSATPSLIAEMRRCMKRSREATSWRAYESLDNRLHRLIAEASQNSLLVGLHDTLNAVRRAVTWGRLRAEPLRPAADHHSFTEHEAIVAAIEDRDMASAAAHMRAHLQSVERKLLARPAAEKEEPRT